MNAPEINIAFEEKAVTAIERSQRGIVLMLVKDRLDIDNRNPAVILSPADIPDSFDEKTKEQIELALMGYQNQPSKVLVYAMAIDDEDETDVISNKYDTALKKIENIKFNYMAVPTVETDEQVTKIQEWIIAQRKKGKGVHAVLPNCEANNEGIINYTTNEHQKSKYIYMDYGDYGDERESILTYNAEQYCSRIAGIICGTPLDMSCTYAPLAELTNVKYPEGWDINEHVKKGELVAFYDGEKVKLSRAVNSLTDSSSGKGESFKKIKLVEAMDMINDDIRTTIQDSYIGKYANSYDNKCILLVAISGYFDGLVADNIVSTYSVDIDIESTKAYLKSNGIVIDDMTDEEIRQQDTGSNVFISITAKLLDAMEDFYFKITI